MKSHLKRLAVPKTWKINRKENKFTVRPRPGAHNMRMSLSLNTILKDVLDYADSTKEVKYVLTNRNILVDGRKRNEHKLSVGFMDVIGIPDIKENYRVLINENGKLIISPIDAKESDLKLSKIINKKLVKGKTQLNLSDGRNVLVEKDVYRVGDSLLLKLPEQKIAEHIKLENGAAVLLTGGNHIGEICVVDAVSKNKIMLKSKNGALLEARKNDVFTVGREKPAIKIE